VKYRDAGIGIRSPKICPFARFQQSDVEIRPGSTGGRRPVLQVSEVAGLAVEIAEEQKFAGSGPVVGAHVGKDLLSFPLSSEDAPVKVVACAIR